MSYHLQTPKINGKQIILFLIGQFFLKLSMARLGWKILLQGMVGKWLSIIKSRLFAMGIVVFSQSGILQNGRNKPRVHCLDFDHFTQQCWRKINQQKFHQSKCFSILCDSKIQN